MAAAAIPEAAAEAEAWTRGAGGAGGAEVAPLAASDVPVAAEGEAWIRAGAAVPPARAGIGPWRWPFGPSFASLGLIYWT